MCWQKQSPEVFLEISQNSQEKSCQEKSRPATLSKKRLWYLCFPAIFAKFLRTPFLQNTSIRMFLHWLLTMADKHLKEVSLNWFLRRTLKQITKIWTQKLDICKPPLNYYFPQERIINPFHANVRIYYPLKKFRKPEVFWCFLVV